jgi:hypothetical protein
MNDKARGSEGLAIEDPPIERLTTGSRELDEILGGGIPENSINILMGEPGSGKTTLAEQFIFANADDEQRSILYLTTLSEPLDKVIKYLQQFEFFDAEKMGARIQYDALGAELAANGVGALLPRLKKAIKSSSPKIIVIDSFKAIHDLASSTQEMRLMLHEVAGMRPTTRPSCSSVNTGTTTSRRSRSSRWPTESSSWPGTPSARETSAICACSSSAAVPIGRGITPSKSPRRAYRSIRAW